MEIDNKKLTEHNGKNGKPVYVAVNGKVYDLSESRLWKNGMHMNRHQAGENLSDAFGAAPHGLEVLNKFKEVGVLKEIEKSPQPPVPMWLWKIMEVYPFLKRHPHPMIVHFPMAFLITTSLLLLWYYVVSPVNSLLDTIFVLHILATISLPFAIISGWISWKVNYFGKRIGYITRKIIMSFIVLVFAIIVMISLVYHPEILMSPHGMEIFIPIFIISYLPIVALIGHHGGQLVY